jgi:type II secretory pathway pseudopilin PulG
MINFSRRKSPYASSGFSIVELLVVVVTIVILAMITIVMYNDAQVRARNTQTASAVRVYKEALNLYRSINRSYPQGNNPTDETCLGSSYQSNQCWYNDVTENATFMTQLEGVQGGKLPMPAIAPKNLKGAYFAPIKGAGYYDYTLDGVRTDFIVYAWEGTAPCPVGPIASNAGDANALTYSATPPANGQTEAPSGANPAQCFVPLPAAQ